MKITFCIVAFTLLFSGCVYNQSPKVDLSSITQANLKQLSWEELNDIKKDDIQSAFRVFLQDCKSEKNNLVEICTLAFDTNDSTNFFQNNFTPYQLFDDKGSKKGIITGYYEPQLFGSKTKTEKYKYPIHKLPNDLVYFDSSLFTNTTPPQKFVGKIKEQHFIPYDTREEINIRDDLEAICYVDSPIDLFFLHIQGSGRITLDTNETIFVGYKENNGRDYFAIGKKLIEDGEIQKEDISMQSIEAWLKNNPNKMEQIFNFNERYIFFEETNQSASGSLGIELVAGRNIAIDTSIIPLGYPVLLKTTNPITKEKIKKIVIAADTGAAIKGKIRADYFCGYGEDAKELSGKMKQEGELILFIPNKKSMNEN